MSAKRVAFQRFLQAMRKLSVEVNDLEICKRLDILMATSKEDLPVAPVGELLADPLRFDPKNIPEPYTQYARHYVYMVKRNARLDPGLPSLYESKEGNEEGAIEEGGRPTGSSGSPSPASKPPAKPKSKSSSAKALVTRIAKKKSPKKP